MQKISVNKKLEEMLAAIKKMTPEELAEMFEKVKLKYPNAPEFQSMQPIKCDGCHRVKTAFFENRTVCHWCEGD